MPRPGERVRRRRVRGAALVFACVLGGWTLRAAVAEPGDVWRFDRAGIRSTPEPTPEERLERFPIYDQKGMLSFVSRTRRPGSGEQRLEFPWGPLPALDLRHAELSTLVARDGSAVVQYGRPPMAGDTEPVALHWLRSQGSTEKLPRSLSLPSHAQVVMSADGYVAAGIPEGPGARVQLFDPAGLRLLERYVGEGALADLRVLPRGDVVLVQTRSLDDPTADHKLFVLRRRGSADSALEEMSLTWRGLTLGTIQRVVELGQGLLFVQGLAHVALLDVTSPQAPRWIRAERLRLASPEGARLGPRGRAALLLVSLEDKDHVTGQYTWRLGARDLGTGDPLGAGPGTGTVTLPDAFRGSWEPVFEQVSGTHVLLLAPPLPSQRPGMRVSIPYVVER